MQLNNNNPLMSMGRVVKTHGLTGELKIKPSCDSPAFLAQFKTLHIGGKPRRVTASRPHKDALLVKVEDVDNVDAAMALIGADVAVPYAEARAALLAGRYYINDLVGCKVQTLDGDDVGVLADVLNLPAHDVYVVNSAAGQFMIPVVDAFVKNIDIDAKVIAVQLIEGMMP